jgi:hypothetical protein
VGESVCEPNFTSVYAAAGSTIIVIKCLGEIGNRCCCKWKCRPVGSCTFENVSIMLKIISAMYSLYVGIICKHAGVSIPTAKSSPPRDLFLFSDVYFHCVQSTVNCTHGNDVRGDAKEGGKVTKQKTQ